MAAGDNLTGKSRLRTQDRQGNRVVLLGEYPYANFTTTSVQDAMYVNGGAPAGGGRSISSLERGLKPGEFLIWEVKVTTAATQDSDHANNDVQIPVTVKDQNRGTYTKKVLSNGDRNTDILADDPALLTTRFGDVMIWKVPDGEEWDLGPGELRLRGATTA